MSDSRPAWRLRPADSTDAERIAVIHREAFRAALPFLPTLHTPDEDVEFFASVIAQQRVEVAESAVDGVSQIAGFIAWTSGWINHLYVWPNSQRRGIGTRLLDTAKQWHRGGSVPGVVDLWTFQRNTSARRFYHQQGFVPVEFTDGRGNEEKEPDIRFQWRTSPELTP